MCVCGKNWASKTGPGRLGNGSVRMDETMSIRKLLLLVVLLGCFSGCNYRPLFGPQGPMQVQQQKSNIHDPFPSNELGPAIDGVRPLGFEQPRSEVSSLQQSPYARKSFQGGASQPNYGF